MCLILFSWDNHPKYKLVVSANRDEFYERSTQSLKQWKDHKNIYAGRDLLGGGTWLGVTDDGKFTALTNHRDPQNNKENAPSRGELTKSYLTNRQSEETFYEKMEPNLMQYNGFNLLNGSFNKLTYFNNQRKGLVIMKPGIYGLSNALLDTPWPKVENAKKDFSNILKENNPSEESLISFMQNKNTAPDAMLPSTGVPLDWEKRLSAIFIESEKYGTCCTTLVTVDYDGNGSILEKSHPVGGRTSEVIRFEFKWN